MALLFVDVVVDELGVDDGLASDADGYFEGTIDDEAISNHLPVLVRVFVPGNRDPYRVLVLATVGNPSGLLVALMCAGRLKCGWGVLDDCGTGRGRVRGVFDLGVLGRALSLPTFTFQSFFRPSVDDPVNALVGSPCRFLRVDRAGSVDGRRQRRFKVGEDASAGFKEGRWRGW